MTDETCYDKFAVQSRATKRYVKRVLAGKMPGFTMVANGNLKQIKHENSYAFHFVVLISIYFKYLTHRMDIDRSSEAGSFWQSFAKMQLYAVEV